MQSDFDGMLLGRIDFNQIEGSSMKIVVLDGYTLNPGDLSWQGMEELGEFLCYDRTPLELIEERIADADAVITNKTPLSAAILAACPGIKYIGVLATGYNVVDIEAASDAGIPVCNIPAYGTEAVAQFAFALLLNICSSVQEHSDSVHNGKWSRSADFCYWDSPLMELSGKTMGIFGYGRIGRAAARIALGFGMRVVAYSRSRESGNRDGEVQFVTRESLFSDSDVISLHCPLTSETEGIINAESIRAMKAGVILINTSRGALIVEEDLADSLKNGRIRAAALDVVSTEPVKEDNPLLSAPNCTITPHIAWAPLEARKRLMDIAVGNLKAFQCGRLENRVN